MFNFWVEIWYLSKFAVDETDLSSMNDVTLDRNDAESLILQETSSIGTVGENQTTTVAPPEEDGDITDDTTLIIAFSAVVIILIFIVFLFYCKVRNQNAKALQNRARSSHHKDRSKHHRPSPDRNDDNAGLPKSPSLASVQSTGSTYYDQLMGSGNIPKVQSISQYGALLAQHVPPK